MRPGYGSGGRIGLGVPQANPTVEAEFGILLPRTCVTLVTRLTSAASDPSARLRHYLTALDEALGRYDTLQPDIFGFACTGSSYLLGHDAERTIVDAAERRHDYSIVTATTAIRWALGRLGARKLALIAPYPPELVTAAAAYWRAAGFEIVSIDRIETGSDDTRSIYALAGDSASDLVAMARRSTVDAVLLTGTGMPSLATIADASSGGERAVPVLSSNMALAGALLDRLMPGLLPPDAIAPAGWPMRLAEAIRSELVRERS